MLLNFIFLMYAVVKIFLKSCNQGDEMEKGLKRAERSSWNLKSFSVQHPSPLTLINTLRI